MVTLMYHRQCRSKAWSPVDAYMYAVRLFPDWAMVSFTRTNREERGPTSASYGMMRRHFNELLRTWIVSLEAIGRCRSWRSDDWWLC